MGITLAALLAWAWSRYGHRVNLALFFQVTSIFLLLFAVQLLVYSFHELTEAKVLPLDNQYWHDATEAYAEGVYARDLLAGPRAHSRSVARDCRPAGPCPITIGRAQRVMATIRCHASSRT